jgi:hypothetical protein
MKKTFYALCLILVALTFNSCDLEDDGPNFHFVPLQITSVDVPASFELNETYEITVNYVLPDGCTYYEGFDFTKPELTTRNIVAVGSQRTDQAACQQVTTETTTTFDFEVIYDEPYLFRFWQSEDENGEQQYLEIEIPVN